MTDLTTSDPVKTSHGKAQLMELDLKIAAQMQYKGVTIRLVAHPQRKYRFGIVAVDVVRALGSKTSAYNICRSVPSVWKGTYYAPTISPTNALIIILWAPGVYQLLSNSKNKEALPFSRWLTGQLGMESLAPTTKVSAQLSIPTSPAQLILQNAEQLAKKAQALVELELNLTKQTEELEEYGKQLSLALASIKPKI